MSRKPLARYKDSSVYASELEEVYDMNLVIDFDGLVSATTGLITFTIQGYDMHDIWREDGPIVYVHAECSPTNADKREKAIIRALTEIARQCLENYAERLRTR